MHVGTVVSERGSKQFKLIIITLQSNYLAFKNPL